MEKIGLAICYAGIGCFYGVAAWALVKFTKAALPNRPAEPAPEAAAEAEAEAVPA